MQPSRYLDKVQRPYSEPRFWGRRLFRSLRWPILVLASLLPLVLLTTAVPDSAHAAVCGDGILDPGEECDDGNAIDGDCCSSSCTNEPAGSPCEDDSNACTNDICDGAGLCSHADVPNRTVLTFAAGADTYSDIDARTTNFGTSDVLKVDGRPGRRAYLRFDVSGITGLSIESAIVRMQTTDASNAGSDETGGDMHTVSDNTWDELTLTHDNRPPLDGPPLSRAGQVKPSETVDFDVTPAVTGDGIYNFGIEPGSNNGTSYRSRESDTGQPALIVSIVTWCDDGDACTQADTCVDGSCVGGEPMVCTASDQCHEAGTCDPATGVCSNPEVPEDTPCNDGDLCTLVDTCEQGVCGGADPVVCTALDQCHVAGLCDPATGLCSEPAKANGSPCDDADACTQTDSCVDGSCVGADPIVCTSSDQCYDAGTCEPTTGLCPEPAAKADGSPCDDSNPCTQTDTCLAGLCTGANPVICTAADQCHDAGTCSPATGQCSNPAKADGSPCDDADPCTQADTCSGGACSGANPVICTASDQCHDVGTCSQATGQCSKPAKADGSPCDDGNPCTQTDTCIGGACSGTNPVICTASDQCHDAGTCSQATGRCSKPAKNEGSPCDDANSCSENDICLAGECIGEPLPDSDADGFCDSIDLCPEIPDPGQADTDSDGVGDLCQCNAPAPGRCIGGGGSPRSDCLLEVMSAAPVALNRQGTKIKSVIPCSDGDAGCDLDGMRDGQCTFGVAFCFGNADPRYPTCTPSPISSMEVLMPQASRSTSAQQIEQALGALGLEVRRRGRVIADSMTPVGVSQCSPLVRLVMPAPKAGRGRPSLQKFQLLATAMSGQRDKDQFTLACE